MAFDLKFIKSDNSTPWGFRLVGGADYAQPLVVVKINENSIADRAGLCVGDIIVRVNDTSTAGLTHKDAHDLIQSAGLDFIFGVRRGVFTDLLIPTEEDINSEFEALLNESLITQESTCIKSGNTAIHEKNTYSSSVTKEQEQTQEEIKENLSGQEQILSAPAVSQKKWSTFLQRPKQPIPKCKRQEEERQILGEPYRVKIVKQKKRSPEERKVKFQTAITEIEYAAQEVTEESTEVIDSSENFSENYQGDTETVETREELEEFVAEDTAEMDVSEQYVLKETMSNCEADADVHAEFCIASPKVTDIEINPVIESSLSLEEQLAAVQKQLMALSQLPSAIQVTLEAVTQQLNKIVSAKVNPEEHDSSNYNEDENVYYNDGELDEYNANRDDESSSERAEADITENGDDNLATENLEYEENEVGDRIQEAEEDNFNQDIENPENITNEGEPIEEHELGSYAGMTEEEKEAKIQEEEMLAKKQKAMEEDRRKRDWVARPIILPGGRKWADPDDAAPKTRTPKMSDEKICSTIENFTEVIVGKTKGINFLKFEPPPKKLDYLQRSEVYKLIHDMEPPVSGIGTRAEKILSEEDYYKNKGEP